MAKKPSTLFDVFKFTTYQCWPLTCHWTYYLLVAPSCYCSLCYGSKFSKCILLKCLLKIMLVLKLLLTIILRAWNTNIQNDHNILGQFLVNKISLSLFNNQKMFWQKKPHTISDVLKFFTYHCWPLACHWINYILVSPSCYCSQCYGSKLSKHSIIKMFTENHSG